MSDRSKKQDIEDDGRVIASMNVDGMPWYVEKGPEAQSAESAGRKEPLSKKEARYFTWGVLRAAFLVAGAFAVVYFLFILFCTQVWFA